MFDYGYVEASTDNGATWTPLKGKYTTTDNPNGTSLRTRLDWRKRRKPARQQHRHSKMGSKSW